MHFKDIPQLTRDGNYRIDSSWTFLEDTLYHYSDSYGLDLDPPFQRAHVWSKQQQEKYVEFCLKGGTGSSELRFNCNGWMNNPLGPIVIVDGKQRLEAVRSFLRNETKAFGLFFNQFKGELRLIRPSFSIRINDLKTDKEVLQWYLDINSGGVAHTSEELDKVQKMLAEMG